MLDYFKYLLSPIILGINAYGLWLGGDYAWLGVGVLVLVLLFDALLKNDFSTRDQRHVWIYDAIVTMTVLAGFADLLFYVWLVGQGHFTTTSSTAGALLSMMFIGFVVAAPPVHELFHRENAFLRWLGRMGLCLILDPWREITHVITHHLRTATPDDPDYARRGDTVYGHFLRTFPGQWKEAYHLEKMIWTKRGRVWWDIRNPWVYRVAQLLIFTGVLVAVGGWKALPSELPRVCSVRA